MRAFQRLAQFVNVAPLAHALQRKPGLWNANTFRTTFNGTPHAEADDILLRFEDIDIRPGEEGFDAAVANARFAWQPAWDDLPEVRAVVLPLMMHVGAYELDRLMITRLAPGKIIAPHADLEPYAMLPDIARYHLVIQGLPGSLFHCGAETVCMQTGEVWWFDAHQVHFVENNSVDDRIHLLIDVRLM